MAVWMGVLFYALNLYEILLMMTRVSIFIIIVFASGSIFARSPCVDLNGQQSYQPLSVESGTICFIREPVLAPKTAVPIGADAIALYYIPNGGVPVMAEGRGLPYDEAAGEIVDAFSDYVDHDHRRIFVIHYMMVRNSLAEPNSSGKFYPVSVFDVLGKILRRDEQTSEWFGANYSWLSNGKRIVYKYP